MVCTERSWKPGEPGDESSSSYVSAETVDTTNSDFTLILSREIEDLGPWFIKACQWCGRQPEGLSGIKPSDIPDLLLPLIEGNTPRNPCQEVPLVFTMKNAIEDLKRFYAESYLEQLKHEDEAGSLLNEWFWKKTAAGVLLTALDEICQESSDRMMNIIGTRFIKAGQDIRIESKAKS